MKEKEKDKIMAFDTLFTTNTIQMYKVLLSYMQPALQKKFAVYIKFMELQYTISFFQNHPYALLKAFPHEEKMNTTQLFDELLPFCDQSQREKMNQFKSMMQNIENMQEMMETIQIMKDLFPTGEGNNGQGGMDMSQIFNMFGGSDMSGMFDMFNAFSSSQESDTTDAS